ncbi:response regulator transcription factor [Azospirillum canadense]|uniref:response regulator transcription factor n=1 Tax=Azospirillum canadense TaxID=403962 RepID=UPI0022273D87|nr:response regulator [Azospirillum canadense]MCW2239054.1 two-component system response regulator FixJ [Azospirillum canadense]
MAETSEGIVYVVDDDEPVRDSMKALLEACALEVRDFESCQSFIDQFDGTPAGCLVLDLHLPIMSGLEFIERYGPTLHGLPVIMVSGRGDPATFARAREAGVSAFLEKPFEADQLLDAVQRLLPAAA